MARKNLIRRRRRSNPVLDVESRLTEDKHQSLKLWLRMLSCTTLIETEIRSRLRTEFGITLPRFDLMAQLDRHPEGLRMGELSKRMMVTGATSPASPTCSNRKAWCCATRCRTTAAPSPCG
jgi:hypothetical protein